MNFTDDRKRKRADCDYTETGLFRRDNTRPRRVDPDRLAARLPEGLVKEMDSYIYPGAVMPSFAIRKDLQERYMVDRRPIYDYLHSRGLRVSKEDRTSNLTRARASGAISKSFTQSHRKHPPQEAKNKLSISSQSIVDVDVPSDSESESTPLPQVLATPPTLLLTSESESTPLPQVLETPPTLLLTSATVGHEHQQASTPIAEERTNTDCSPTLKPETSTSTPGRPGLLLSPHFSPVPPNSLGFLDNYYSLMDYRCSPLIPLGHRPLPKDERKRVYDLFNNAVIREEMETRQRGRAHAPIGPPASVDAYSSPVAAEVESFCINFSPISAKRVSNNSPKFPHLAEVQGRRYFRPTTLPNIAFTLSPSPVIF